MRILLSALLAAVFAAPAVVVPASAADVVLRGNYVHGPGVSLLQPCSSDKGLWVDEFSPAAKELIRRQDEMTARAYEEVFVEVKGWTRSRKPEDGLPPEYDAIFSPTEVLEVRAKESGC